MTGARRSFQVAQRYSNTPQTTTTPAQGAEVPPALPQGGGGGGLLNAALASTWAKDALSRSKTALASVSKQGLLTTLGNCCVCVANVRMCCSCVMCC